MTSLTMHRPWTAPTLRNAMVVRQRLGWADCIGAVALILRPLVVTFGIVAAAVMWPAHAHADVVGDSGASTLNGIGIGNNVRYWFREDAYNAPRSYVDFSLQYRVKVLGDERAEGRLHLSTIRAGELLVDLGQFRTRLFHLGALDII